MARKKISELDPVDAVDLGDLLVVWADDATKRATVEQVLNEAGVHSGNVVSVNGQTGAVNLDAADVGADVLGAASAAIASLGSAATASVDDFDTAGAAVTEVTSHEAASDPHPQYLTQAEGDGRYRLGGPSSVSSSDIVDGTIVNGDISTSAAIAYSKLVLNGAILNSDLAGSIAYAKLVLNNSIVNADIATGASIAYSKLNLAGAIQMSDISGSIPYSKLSLTGAVLNADLAGSIALTKLANQSNNTVLGNVSGSVGPPTALTAANLKTLLALDASAGDIANFDTRVRTSRLDQMAAPTAAVGFNSQKLTGLADGTATTDAATYGQLTSLAQGQSFKPSVKAATTANITLSGTQTIDTVALIANDRALVKDQTTASQNGIYVVAAGAWSRATDMDAAGEFTKATVLVESGSANLGTVWTQTATVTTVGTDTVTWVKSGAGNTTYSADGSTLDLTGTTFSVHSGGIGTTQLAASAVTDAKVSGSAAIAYSKLALTGAILNADLAGSIAYSKLALSGAILNGDLAGSIALSKLATQAANTFVANATAGTAVPTAISVASAKSLLAIAYADIAFGGNIVNTDINAAAAIAYSKLNLTGAILSADLAGSIALSKLATQATNTLVGNATGGTAAPTALSASAAKTLLAIAYADINFGGNIANADLAGNIALSKLATQGANTVVANITGSIAGPTAVSLAGFKTWLAMAYADINFGGNIVNTDIKSTAAIARSKLDFGSGLVNTDIATGAAIGYAKLNLTASIVNADVSATAAIGYSKLDLTNSISNADIAAGTQISLTKIAAIADQRILGNVSGTTASASAMTATSAKTFLAIAPADVSGFDTQVRTSRLDQMAAPTAAVSFNSQRITSVGNPTAFNDASPYGFWLLSQRLVRAATTANIATLAGGAPSTLDGISLVVNDRVLVKDQTTASQNGIYTVSTVGTGANGTWARTSDADDANDFLGATVTIQQGTTQGGSVWRQTATVATVGTDAVSWSKIVEGNYAADGTTVSLSGRTFSVATGGITNTQVSATAAIAFSKLAAPTASFAFGSQKITSLADPTSAQDAATKNYVDSTASGFVRKYTTTIGDNTTSSFVVTHNLNTQDIVASVRDASGNIFSDFEVTATSTTTATFNFVTAPTTSQYKVVVVG